MNKKKHIEIVVIMFMLMSSMLVIQATEHTFNSSSSSPFSSFPIPILPSSALLGPQGVREIVEARLRSKKSHCAKERQQLNARKRQGLEYANCYKAELGECLKRIDWSF